MEFFLDDNQQDTALADISTVEDALHHVQSALCASGRVVVGIRCDGQDIPSTAMVETLRKPTSSVDRLEVFTGTRAELVDEAMQQASVCLAETDTACKRVAGLLTEGQTVDAVEALGECLRIWQQVHEAVAKSIEMLQLSAEQTAVNGVPLIELVSKPKEVLLQVRDALQASDYVLLADILQYEFQEVTEQWQAIIARLREEAASKSHAAD